MDIYLIRHGQTFWNKEFRWQGHTDIELDETGLVQAASAAERLMGCNISAIYSSPLKRARVTAETIGGALGLTPFFREDLREIAFGHWEGLRLDDVRQLHTEQLRVWESEPDSDPGDGIESYAQLRNRAVNALREICNKHGNNDTIAIVTHGAWIRALILYTLNIPLDSRLVFDLDNVGVSILRYDIKNDRLKVKTLNERSFLK